MDGHTDTDTDTDEPTGGMPRIADYWPDLPHRMGPEADYIVEDGAPVPESPRGPEPTRVFSPPPGPRRRGLRLLLGALAAVVFLGGSVLALGRLVLSRHETTAAAVETTPTQSAPAGDGIAGAPSPPVSIAPEPTKTAPSAAAPPAPSATSTTPPFTSGTFELTGDVTVLTMTVADLGADPVRFSIPSGSGLRPRLSRDGSTVRLDPRPDGSKGNGRIDVRLNRRITWSLRMTGGVTTATYELADGRIRRIDLIGGAARIDMSLATPDDTLPIRMTGGVSTWTITTAEEVPVSVRLRDGGGRVVLNGDRTDGLDRDDRVRAGGGDGVKSGGLAIDAVAGLGTLIVRPADGTT